MKVFDIIVCPSCGSRVCRDGGSIVCSKGHSFDIASSGYVNLLPPGKSRNSHTGDDKIMIRARCDFLSLGLYDGISDAVAVIAAKHVACKNELVLVDAGCGEGYHICRIAQKLSDSAVSNVTAIGLDASKNGAATGAKRASKLGLSGSLRSDAQERVGVYFAAANIFAMPIADKSTDIIFSMFAPIPGEEAMRVLADDGALIVVSAGEDHLYELREVLYDEPRKGDGTVAVPSGFAVIDKAELKYRVHVPDNAALMNLFSMTPFFYRTPETGRKRLADTDSLDITVQIVIYVIKKGP